MRITNSTALRSSLTELESNRTAIDTLQAQISSGLRLTRPSDDPVGVSEVMHSSSSLKALEQYKRNIDSATARNSSEGTALDQLTNILSRAKELAVSQATGTANAATRKTAAAEMEQLFNSAVALASTKNGNEYLFGGDAVTQAPFTGSGTGATLDFTSTSPSGSRAVAVSAGQTLVATHDGQQLFGDSGVLAALRDATRALQAGDQASITNAMPSIDSAFDNVQVLQGEQGARANALDVASQNMTALKANLTAYRSQLQEVDIESAVTELVTKQTSYQAAMLATSKILGMTLTDYLR
ncbi:MAG: flagellin domain protein [Gemmatimonadetes bacterium]|nr:flagellin domain protein [Gemmatimonadota bacterium]